MRHFLTVMLLAIFAGNLFAAEIELPGQVVNIDGVLCASSTYTTDKGLCVSTTPDPDPDPGPTPGPITKIGLAGCSQTNNWVGEHSRLGFEDYFPELGDLFTDTSGQGGGALPFWATENTGRRDYRGRYRTAVAGQNIDAHLLQVCVARTNGSIEQLRTVISWMRSLVDVPVYLQTLDAAPNSALHPLSNCSFAGWQRSQDLIDQALSEGIALRGPDMRPPYAVSETRDNCHPNDAGTLRQSREVRRWFDGL